MKTLKEFMPDKNQIADNELNEITAMGVVSAIKLQKAVSRIKSTNDTNEKIDLLTKALVFSLGTLSLQLQKTRKRRR